MICGMDVGSTTAKYLLFDEEKKKILAKDYQRHNTRQAEKVLEFLTLLEEKFNFKRGQDRLYFTGSGSGIIAPLVGGKIIQEVVAVAKAVEKLYPDCHFVSEIGGEDSKMIFFSSCQNSSIKNKQFMMQSVCSGGTGTFIEKLARKLQIPLEELCQMRYSGKTLHKISAKCGIFAELDINSLVKSGIDIQEIIASVFEAVVSQNLLTLTKGNTPLPQTILLGGPNTFFQGLKEAWFHHLTKIWQERNIDLQGKDPQDLILIPENSLYFASHGLLYLASEDSKKEGLYQGREKLDYWVKEGQYLEKKNTGKKAFFASQGELQRFLEEYGRVIKTISDKPIEKNRGVKVFLGCDFGSTTAKAVALSERNEFLFSCYAKSKGNPIEDTQEMFRQIKNYFQEDQILAIATTGYGKDLIKSVIGADLAVTETIAHATAGLFFFPEADCIVDVGGVDTKIMILKMGTVNDFRLNSQCSSGNGAFLQEIAERFQIPIEKVAEKIFEVKAFPQLTMGCGVFLQSDIVNQQKRGWAAEEILAGLCAIIPKNVWIYAGGLNNLSVIGKKIILQGGTHRNLAVVKAQIDFIKGKIPDAQIFLHPYPGEAGAIGAALLAKDWYERNLSRGQTPGQILENEKEQIKTKRSFLGFDFIENISYQTITSEKTTCHWCAKNCRRTFIDVQVPGAKGRPWSKLPLAEGWERLIINNSCPKGLVEDINELREVKDELDKKKEEFPNIADFVRLRAFSPIRDE